MSQVSLFLFSDYQQIFKDYNFVRFNALDAIHNTNSQHPSPPPLRNVWVCQVKVNGREPARRVEGAFSDKLSCFLFFLFDLFHRSFSSHHKKARRRDELDEEEEIKSREVIAYFFFSVRCETRPSRILTFPIQLLSLNCAYPFMPISFGPDRRIYFIVQESVKIFLLAVCVLLLCWSTTTTDGMLSLQRSGGGSKGEGNEYVMRICWYNVTGTHL